VDSILSGDLLDGIGPIDAPLVVAFTTLCRHLGVRGKNVEPVLRRMRTIQGLEHLRLPDEVTDRILDKACGTEDASGAHLTSIARGTYSSNWGTSVETIAAVIDAFGTIDLDLCSSAEHNKTVGARAWYSEERPCPEAPEILLGDVVYCNPPGPSVFVKDFWRIWLGCLSRGAVGAFLVFNADTARGLEPPAGLYGTLLRKRQRFVGAPSSASFPSLMVSTKAVALGHPWRWLMVTGNVSEDTRAIRRAVKHRGGQARISAKTDATQRALAALGPSYRVELDGDEALVTDTRKR